MRGKRSDAGLVALLFRLPRYLIPPTPIKLQTQRLLISLDVDTKKHSHSLFDWRALGRIAMGRGTRRKPNDHRRRVVVALPPSGPVAAGQKTTSIHSITPSASAPPPPYDADHLFHHTQDEPIHRRSEKEKMAGRTTRPGRFASRVSSPLDPVQFLADYDSPATSLMRFSIVSSLSLPFSPTRSNAGTGDDQLPPSPIDRCSFVFFYRCLPLLSSTSSLCFAPPLPLFRLFC